MSPNALSNMRGAHALLPCCQLPHNKRDLRISDRGEISGDVPEYDMAPLSCISLVSHKGDELTARPSALLNSFGAGHHRQQDALSDV